MIYTHVVNRGSGAVRSPADRLPTTGRTNPSFASRVVAEDDRQGTTNPSHGRLLAQETSSAPPVDRSARNAAMIPTEQALIGVCPARGMTMCLVFESVAAMR